MSNRLVLLLGDFEGTEREVAELLCEWSNAGILGTVAWASTSQGARPTAILSDSRTMREWQLFELLASRIWRQVSVVAIREPNLSTIEKVRYEREDELLQLVESAFAAHEKLEFQSLTVSIAEQSGLESRAFSTFWKLHILHEPVVRIDQVVASQPMWDEHRHLLVSLLALAMAGGFVWQHGVLAPGLSDQIVSDVRPIRMGRAYLRVVSAGRLTDEVLAGAFPKSGPWSVPSDLPNAIAVPPATPVPDGLVRSLIKVGQFGIKPWVDPEREKPKQIRLWDGIKLFLKEFGDALRGIPGEVAAQFKREVEEFVQKTTFGENASVLLSFDTTKDDLSPTPVIEILRGLNLGSEIDPVGTPVTWEILQRVSLGLVDGGKFPDSIQHPVSGANRLVYTDPAVIGPAPDDVSFSITPFEIAILKLGETKNEIGPMAISDALTLKAHLDALKSEVDRNPNDSVNKQPAKNPSSATANAIGNQAQSHKMGWWKRRRLRKKMRRERKRLAKAGKTKTPQLEAGVESNRPLQNISDHAPAVSVPDTASTGAPVTSANDAVKSTDLANVDGEKLPVDETSRHSPSHPSFDPREYTPVGVFYQGDRPEVQVEYQESNQVCRAAESTYRNIEGRFSKNKSCDHCGTVFDHGVLYVHEPTQSLIRVGNICARKSLPLPDHVDLLAKRLSDFEVRFSEWLARRSGSLLWQVGDSLIRTLTATRRDLAKTLEMLSSQPVLDSSSSASRKKFGRWTRRGAMSVLLVIGAALASIVMTPIPLLLAVLMVTIYFSGFVIRIIFLARDIVRAKYRFRLAMDDYERSYRRARHDVSEMVRLSSLNDQFHDWQIVLREVVHLPFGRQLGFASSGVALADVTRPPAMILGKSQPDDRQKMRLFLSARRQTIHAGWLTEVVDILKQDWRSDYENVRVTTSADNLAPEADNSPTGSVVGKRPLSDDDVYFPRSDFRRRVVSGDLQQLLVMKKAELIADELRTTSLDKLLAKVDVDGLGSALSGQTVETFLTGLQLKSERGVKFPADLISDRYPNHRLLAPEMVLPIPSSDVDQSNQIQVEPGVELTAAAWRVELSDPIHPLEVLKGYVAEVRQTYVPPERLQCVGDSSETDTDL